MTIEQRLERLAERHEALTQTVEIIAAMQRENERLAGRVIRVIEKLSKIAESHERRLNNLEGK